tara:strand:+ start:1895 stop:2809 length:915 start_codon:yes stop_codon:yes gene_type:complete
MPTSKNIIAICIATYNRPELLANCLDSISKIDLPENYKTIIIIVDNDKEKSAENTFNTCAKNISFDSHYFVEPDRGICSARNCLLDRALLNNASYIAFMDDDEQAHKKWLVNLIRGIEHYKCDVVVGPAIPFKGTSSPDTFEKDPKHPSGSKTRNISTANVLFNTRLIDELNLRFDRYFDFIGCEDHDFFDRAKKLGATATWVDDAATFEAITPERSTRRYLMFRHFTGGINVVMRFRRHHSLTHAWFRYLPKSIGKVIGAIYTLIIAAFVSRSANFDKSIVKFSNAVGYLFGLMNIVFERYRY